MISFIGGTITMQISDQIFIDRQSKLSTSIVETGLDAIVLNPSASLVYLTGLNIHSYERPIIVIFTPQYQPVFVLPELESNRTKKLAFPAYTVSYSDDPASWQNVFQKSTSIAGIQQARKIGIDLNSFRVLELRYLEKAINQAEFVDARDILSVLRISKGESEIMAMRNAVNIAQMALQSTLPQVQIGMTERELASELTLQLYRNGCDPSLPFSPIVASGPNSANPHATPSERALSPGDMLVIDWGASYQGYLSDLTRTFAVREISPEQQKISQTVITANLAAQTTVMPTVSAGQVDQAARSVIEKAGYGKYFIHRTGHGLGIEAHEEPYIRAGNPLQLKPGMAFTIEPGIYLPGEYGVRVEDNLVVTATGSETLSNLTREILVVG
jgi:Xaa-Pro dipeptidase